MLRAVVEAGFQLKNGAAFAQGEQYTEFDFGEKYSPDWKTTYQVPRARFDHLLALEAEAQGAEVRYRQEVVGINIDGNRPRLTIKDSDDEHYLVDASFLLDASGFGRILPRLLQLKIPSNFPVRGAAVFTHIEDRITQSGFDRNKIRVTVHPKRPGVWFWLIPFTAGRCSLGVVTEPALLERYQGTDTQRLQALVGEDRTLSNLLENACWDTPARRIVGMRPTSNRYQVEAMRCSIMLRSFSIRFFVRSHDRFQIGESCRRSPAVWLRRGDDRLA
jgi:flavin-dependent dehydrogenase